MSVTKQILLIFKVYSSLEGRKSHSCLLKGSLEGELQWNLELDLTKCLGAGEVCS